jgi:hypothetical protein
MTDIRESILSSDGLKREEITAFGQKFIVRELTQGEDEKWFIQEMSKAQENGKLAPDNMNAHLLICCAEDFEKKPLFNKSDVSAVNQLPSRDVAHVVDRIMSISGKYDVQNDDEQGQSGDDLGKTAVAGETS